MAEAPMSVNPSSNSAMAANSSESLEDRGSFCSHHTLPNSSSCADTSSSLQCTVCGGLVSSSGDKGGWSSSSATTLKTGLRRKGELADRNDGAHTSFWERLLQSVGCNCTSSTAVHNPSQNKYRQNEARMFSYKELNRATNGFDVKFQLGQGGFGVVYKGVLPTGMIIAAKKIAANSSQGVNEFVSELTTIGRIGRMRHKNLVPLLGWCQYAGGMILVYEYMEGGSLDKLLHQARAPAAAGTLPENPASGPRVNSLTWEQRLRIISDVASALAFLHNGWAHCVIHRDVKSSNILLDKHLNAKLGDFGLAQPFNHGKVARPRPHAGTLGYLAPEAVIPAGPVRDKLDVYSFGVLALEVVCGRSPVDHTQAQDQVVLLEWVWKLKEADRLKDVIDKGLEGKFDEKQITRVVHIGLLCTHLDADQRPSMVDVMRYLEWEMELPPVPRTRPRMTYISGFSNLETGVLRGFVLPPPPVANMDVHV